MRYAPPSKRICDGPRLFLGLTLLLGATSAAASEEAGTAKPRGSGYQLESISVDGGGGESKSTDGRMDLSATIGQPDAGTLRGGDYEMDGGVWEVRDRGRSRRKTFVFDSRRPLVAPVLVAKLVVS